MMRLTNSVLAACLGLAVAACATESEQVAFVETLGNDTVSVEVYSRTADGFEGKLLIRSPMTQVAHYKATLTPDGNVSTMNIEWTTPPENPDAHPPLGFNIAIEGDSATVEMTGPNAGTTRIAAPDGTIPTAGKMPMSYAVLEQAVRQAVAAGGDEYPVHFIVPARGRIAPNAIKRVDEDVVSFDFFGSPFYARITPEGEILHRSGEHTTVKVVGERASDVDFDMLAADYAARDARGEGMGPASPQATVQVEAGGANLEVVYSRPAMRGREIWGGLLVPWEEVWRTGANAATSFTTDRDLVIGGAAVPAGSYTLWSVFTEESAQLIINKQTGQWGTQYDAEQDLVRVDLEKQDLPHPVERFTIGIESTDDGAMLGLTWNTVRYLVPIEVR